MFGYKFVKKKVFDDLSNEVLSLKSILFDYEKKIDSMKKSIQLLESELAKSNDDGDAPAPEVPVRPKKKVVRKRKTLIEE